MSEKLLEEILLELQDETDDSYKQWLYDKFQKSSSTTEATAIACTSLEEFAIYYFGMVKSQTDEFIKSNTSTCNTPHKIYQNTLETDVAEPLLHDNKKNVNAINVGGSLNVHNDDNNSNKSGKNELRFTKRQISRELFVNQDDNQCSDDNNRSGQNESKGRNYSNTSGRQHRKTFADTSSSFGEGQNQQFSAECSTIQYTSTPTSCLNITMKANRSTNVGENMNLTNTSTPNSSYNNTKSSLSFDHSSMVNRSYGGNSSRRSYDGYKNNSASRLNTSSPLCLGDFMSTSSTSGKGGKKKNDSTSNESAMTPKFNSSDFPALNQNVSCSAESKIQQQSKNNSANSNEIAKPKKRVMPITVSRKVSVDSPNFISSSFHSDNNLLNVTTLEADESISLIPERELLREHRDAITKDFSAEHKPIRNLHTLIKENLSASPLAMLSSSPAGPNTFIGNILSTPHKSTTQYDEEKVERHETLVAMARIYSFLIDANHVPNILSEFSYIVNLLNTEYNPYERQTQNYAQMKSSIDIASNLLKNFHNCIFFSMCILNHQKQILGMLDCTTIRVICDYERIQTITPLVYEYLRNIMQKKMQIDTTMSLQRAKSDTNNINKVVFYQQETDNRDNFPSDREFGVFKKQRDMFYAILRSWELKHLDPSWDFRRELGAKVRGLLTLLEHPINMAHLAKLFTAQLIISCNFDNELQMALPNIDLSKLSKLRQRLVAPSLFSTQYLFPGNQAFFRDFIIGCDFHMMFIEQLKIALISELLQMNDSSIETICIAHGNVNNKTAATTTNDDDNKEKNFQQEFIVRAETISTMRVIGKFIGFVVSRLYSYDGYRNSLVDQKQMSIRNLIRPDFDVKSIVLRAIDDHKLLVTMPWLVEYLTMLDFITIRLEYYRELFQILYTIYMRLHSIDGHDAGVCIMPQSKFIIRACLGWLFEHPTIPVDYYNSNMLINLNDVASIKDIKTNDMIFELNPHLENAIHSSCPFLADFRVSMMPQRMTKAVSRTGRYRHITTKIQDKSSSSGSNVKIQGNHERLIEAFLASQSLSVRKIVDFTIDRVTSAVIKDFQVRHLLSIRKEARNAVEMEVSTVKNDVDAMKRKMRDIFHQHYERLLNQWKDDVELNCRKRIEGLFDALLPIETLKDVKRTLINITVEKTSVKLQHWLSTNISIEIFSKDIHIDAVKLVENYQQTFGGSSTATNKRTSSNMIIDLSAEIHPSEYFESLQMNLHRASLHAEKLSTNEIIKFFDMTVNVLDKQTLPSNAYRNIAFYILQLVLLLVANRPELITKEFLSKIFAVWHHEKLLDFTMSLQQTTKLNENDDDDDDDEEAKKCTQNQQNNRLKVNNFIFCNVISSRFILTMQDKDRLNFEVYGNFLIELIKEKFISVEDINQLGTGLFKHEWSKNTLDNIAFLIQHVKSFLPSSHDESAESHLYMEVLADLASDMENY